MGPLRCSGTHGRRKCRHWLRPFHGHHLRFARAPPRITAHSRGAAVPQRKRRGQETQKRLQPSYDAHDCLARVQAE